MWNFEVYDWKDQEIKVGMLCVYGSPDTQEEYENQLCEVVRITDPDVDADDYGRSILICPSVYVKFKNGDEEDVHTVRVTQVTWNDYPDGPESETFQADDLEVLPSD